MEFLVEKINSHTEVVPNTYKSFLITVSRIGFLNSN